MCENVLWASANCAQPLRFSLLSVCCGWPESANLHVLTVPRCAKHVRSTIANWAELRARQSRNVQQCMLDNCEKAQNPCLTIARHATSKKSNWQITHTPLFEKAKNANFQMPEYVQSNEIPVNNLRTDGYTKVQEIVQAFPEMVQPNGGHEHNVQTTNTKDGQVCETLLARAARRRRSIAPPHTLILRALGRTNWPDTIKTTKENSAATKARRCVLLCPQRHNAYVVEAPTILWRQSRAKRDACQTEVRCIPKGRWCKERALE